MLTIDEFIAAEARKPFAWGKTDCAATADRWVQLVRGVSPMALYGRIHAGAAEAQAWLAEPGGIAVAVNRVMRCAGFRRTAAPKPGDVALVPFEGRMCIGIHTGSFWFSRHADGLIGAPLDNLWKAWAV